MSVAIRGSTSVDERSTSLLRWAATTTAVAAILELLLLRIVTRTAIHIPGMDRLPLVYVPLAEAGRFAYYLAAVMVVITIAVQLDTASRLKTLPARIVAAALGAFIAVAIAQRLQVLDETALSLITLASIAAATVAAAIAHGVRARVPVAFYGAAFVLLAAYTSSGGGAGGDSLREAGEALGLAFAISSPLFLPRGRRHVRARWIGIISAVVGFAALAANAATVNILLLWNFGLTGSLPLPLYAVGAGALMYTLTAASRSDRALVGALVLLIVAGFGFHSTYQSALALCGLGMLGLPSCEDAQSVCQEPSSTSEEQVECLS